MYRQLSLRAPILLFIISVGVFAWAQGRHPRQHTATESRPLRLAPATEAPPAQHELKFEDHDGHRHVISNGIPQHHVGSFPNRGNPNPIRPQQYEFSLPLDPQPAAQITSLHQSDRRGPPNMPFGVAVNGLVFDPGTAEFWMGDREAGWNYDALGGAVALGVDENFAHVQRSGAYHYHGIPTGLMKQLGLSPQKHSPQVGWAADGFPIYCQYGYQDPQDPKSKIIELTSSFGLKDGNRPSGDEGPGGKYDGAFIQDYTYDEGVGHLDECNGRYCVTPEFPQGTYAYFLTSDWPVVPRAFRGTPVDLKER